MRALAIAVLAATLFFSPVTGAAAYVGPGAGLSLLGALWGVLIAVGLAVGFVIIWPIRSILKQRRKRPVDMPAARRVGATSASLETRSRSRSV